MTYGIDQCRRCGKSMPMVTAAAVQRYELSLRQRPTMTPAEWRAAGWKAAPTHAQMSDKFDGVCKECRYILGLKRSRKWVALTLAAGALFVFLGIIIVILLSGA